MISLIRISYSFRFIVRRSVSTDSYDRLDFTNFRIRYCTFLLLNKIMAILGCLIAISLDSWWLKGPRDKLNLLKGVFCFIKSSDSKDVNIGRTRKKLWLIFFFAPYIVMVAACITARYYGPWSQTIKKKKRKNDQKWCYYLDWWRVSELVVKLSFRNHCHSHQEMSLLCHNGNQSKPFYRHVYRCIDQTDDQRYSVLDTKNITTVQMHLRNMVSHSKRLSR